MNIIKVCLTIISFMVIGDVLGQNVEIKGEAKGAEGKIVSLVTYSDRITYTEKKLGSCLVDNNGNFEIKAQISQTILAYLKIDYFKSEIYIEAGKNYRIKITPDLVNQLDDKINPYLNLENFLIKIEYPDKDELNSYISRFKGYCNEFIVEKFESLFRSRDKTILEKFKFKLDSSFGSVQNEYLQNQIIYKIASLELYGKILSDNELIMKYISDKAVLFENVEYMEFFNELFDKYFNSNYILKSNSFYASLSGNSSFEDISQEIIKDTLIKDNLVRDMLLMKGMSELYHQDEKNKEAVLRIVETGISKNKTEYGRLIAKNLYSQLTKLKVGTKAPEISLGTANKEKHSLKEFKGKYIYLNFWKSQYVFCLKEMLLMKELHEKYKENIVFISINTDRNKTYYLNFIKEHKEYQWLSLYFENEWDLLNDYEVKSYPLFVLIDTAGRIFKYPAEKPSEGIENLFKKLRIEN